MTETNIIHLKNSLALTCQLDLNSRYSMLRFSRSSGTFPFQKPHSSFFLFALELLLVDRVENYPTKKG